MAASRSRHQPSGRVPITFMASTIQRIGSGQVAAEGAQGVQGEGHVLGAGAEVDEAHAQAAPRRRPRRRPGTRARRCCAASASAALWASRSATPAGTWRKHTVDSCGSCSSSNSGSCAHLAGQLGGQPERVLDPAPERRRAVGAQRQPQLQRVDRPRVLQRALDQVHARRCGGCRTPRGRSCARARPAARTSTTLQPFWMPSHLWASRVTESTRSRPANRWRARAVQAAGRP